VNEVAVFLWTRDGETTDRLWWSEPFQPDVAEAAYTLAERNAELVTALGPAEGMRLIPTTDAYCAWCPFWSPGATDLGAACPGHTGSTANEPPKTLTDALGTSRGRGTAHQPPVAGWPVSGLLEGARLIGSEMKGRPQTT
jgi:hypothetical protein